MPTDQARGISNPALVRVVAAVDVAMIIGGIVIVFTKHVGGGIALALIGAVALVLVQLVAREDTPR